MEPLIAFEDDSLIVLNKPAGWIVNEASTTKNQSVLQTWLSEKYSYETIKSRETRAGIVHRLDKETSGVLLIAKTNSAFYELQRQFKERIVKKTYTALVHGVVNPEEGEIDVPVGRLPWRRDRFGVLPGGREASTAYKVISKHRLSLSKEIFTLINCHPKTGRTHQIRIHMKYIGHPIVADEFYAGRKTARNDRKWCSRLFLHASRIEFVHPATSEVVFFDIGLASDLNDILSSLQAI